jgi:predicted PurR-regulated permease PerM
MREARRAASTARAGPSDLDLPMMHLDSESWSWRAVYTVTLVLVVAAFLFSLRTVFNPFLLFLLLVLLSSPFAGSRSHLLLIASTGLLTLIWMLGTLGSLLAPFFLALVFAYILRPLVRRIEGRRIPRGAAIGILALPVLVAVGLVIFFGIPALAREAGQFLGRLPGVAQRLREWALVQLVSRDFPLVDERLLLARLQEFRPEVVLHWAEGRQAQIARGAWEALVGAGRGVSLALSILGYLFLAPVLTYYLLRDWERIVKAGADLVPAAQLPRVERFVRDYDRLLGGYLRGNFLESAIVGALTWIGLMIAGIPSALLLGVTAAVFNLIPYVGLVLTLIPALIVALFTDNVGMSVLSVVIVFAVVQALDGAVIGPKVVGESVELHPIWVVLSLSVFGFFFGFVGLLLAVPLAVLIKLMLVGGVGRYRRSAIFAGGGA